MKPAEAVGCMGAGSRALQGKQEPEVEAGLQWWGRVLHATPVRPRIGCSSQSRTASGASPLLYWPEKEFKKKRRNDLNLNFTLNCYSLKVRKLCDNFVLLSLA